jgi:hypothetical protein
MARKGSDPISPELRSQMTMYVAWGLTAGCFFIPVGLVLAPLVVTLWWLHRATGRVPASAVGVALVAFVMNVFVLIGMGSQ